MTAAALQKHVANHDNDPRDQMSDCVSDERYGSFANISLLNMILQSFRRMKSHPFNAQNVANDSPTTMIRMLIHASPLHQRE